MPKYTAVVTSDGDTKHTWKIPRAANARDAAEFAAALEYDVEAWTSAEAEVEVTDCETNEVQRFDVLVWSEPQFHATPQAQKETPCD